MLAMEVRTMKSCFIALAKLGFVERNTPCPPKKNPNPKTKSNYWNKKPIAKSIIYEKYVALLFTIIAPLVVQIFSEVFNYLKFI